MEDCYQRTSTDVRDVIKHAKLHESDLTPISQVLKIAEADSNSDNLKFLQLDQHILDELEVGGCVVFKGGKNENAVLCTSTCTYDVKEAETSNSLLLVSNLKWAKDTKPDDDSFDDSIKSDDCTTPNTSLNTSGDSDKINRSPRQIESKDIIKVFYTYFEIRPCKPKFKKLNELLQYTVYSGPEREYAIDKSLLYSLNDLKDIIQASDFELLEGLNNIKAIEIDGHYRVLAFEYELRALSQMLDLIDENSWPLDRISKKITLETLDNLIADVILDGLFDFYTLKTDFIDGEQFYKYNETKVCQIFAKYILKDVGKFNLEDFLKVWKESVPEGMTAELNMLKGLALCDLNSNPQVIWAFNEEKLPENIHERFKILFQTKEKWTVEEISPYIEQYTTGKLDVNALLTKYARGSNQNNVRYYSAKHSK